MSRRKNKGFNLIEVLVAISIISVGLYAVFRAVPLGLSGTNAQAINIQASMLAQEKIEELGAANYLDLPEGIIEEKHDIGGKFTGFNRKSSVSLIDENFAATSTDRGLKLIEVKVWWPKPFNSKSVTMKIVTAKK